MNFIKHCQLPYRMQQGYFTCILFNNCPFLAKHDKSRHIQDERHPQSYTEAMRTRKHIEGTEDRGGCGAIALKYNEVCKVQSRRRGISAKLAKPKYIEFQHCDEAMPLKNCPVIAVLGHNSLEVLSIRENGQRNTGNLCQCYLEVF